MRDICDEMMDVKNNINGGHFNFLSRFLIVLLTGKQLLTQFSKED